MLWFPGVIALLIGTLLPSTSIDESVIAYAGVVKAEGKAVPGATVWLIGGDFAEGNSILATTTTNERGEFRIPYVKNQSLHGLFVRTIDGRMGNILPFSFHSTLDPLHLTCDIPLRRTFTGKLVDQTGAPWVGAVVTPIAFTGGVKRTFRESSFWPMDDHLQVPQVLREKFAATTQEDGTFKIHGAPLTGLFHAQVELKPGYLVQLRCSLEKDYQLEISQPGRLVVQFAGVDNPQELKGSTWRVICRKPGSTMDYWQHSVQTVTHDGSKEMVVSGLCAGKGSIHDSHDSSSPYLLGKLHGEEFTITANETSQLKSRVKRGIKVTGKVVDKETQQGIGSVGIAIRSIPPRFANGTHYWIKTEKDGTFSKYVLPGEIHCSISTLPPAYAPSHPLSAKHQEHTQDFVWPDILLSRGVTLSGQVVTLDGKPVPGAWIYSTQTDKNNLNNRPMTDAHGRFELTHLRRDMIELWVRSSVGVSTHLVKVDLKQPYNAVVIKVDRKAEVYLEGQLEDASMQPVEGVPLTLDVPIKQMPESLEERGLSFRLPPTDGQGRFRAGPLWPGQYYQVRHWMPGSQSEFRSPMRKGEPGTTVDFGKMPMAGTKTVERR